MAHSDLSRNNPGGGQDAVDVPPLNSDNRFASNAATPSNDSRLTESTSTITSDSSFTSTPILTQSSVSSRVQNHAAIQRSPSVVLEQASALSRALSVKSNGSNGSREIPSGILTTVHRVEESDRFRDRDSTSRIPEESNDCSLTKSPSARSTRSDRSYTSLRNIGTIPLGHLRVHSPSPTRVPIEESHEVLKEGDIFIVRDIPVGVVFGYDMRAISVKDVGKFEGIKHLPPGAHLIWASSDVTSLRTGYWIMTSKKTSDEYGEIHVRRWDQYTEILDEVGSVAEDRNQRRSIPEFVEKLQAYDLSVPAATKESESDIWRSLTSCMKGAFLSRLTGKPWNHWPISSTHDYKRDRDPTLDANSALDDRKDEVLAFVFPKDTRTFSAQSLGRERTEQATDTTSHVSAVIGCCTYDDSDEIVGEMQFSFLTGMILGNSACQEHWAHIVRTVFRAYRLAVEIPSFFAKFIRAVHAQLMYNESGFEEGSSILDVESNLRDDLKVILTVFKSRLTEQLLAQGSDLTSEQQAVGTAFEALESWLWKWGWDLRGNYLRKGNVQLEDGTVIDDLELTELEAEDERGRQRGGSNFIRFRKASSTAVKWNF